MSDAYQSAAWDHLMDEFGGPRPAYCLELARRYTSTYPENWPGWFVLSNALWDLGRYRDARSALVQAFRATPIEHRHYAFAQAGHWRSAMGEHTRAARWFRRAVRASGFKKYHVLVGAAFAKAGRLEEAEAWHRRAIAESEGPIDEAYYNLGLILRANERYMDALRALDQALELDPGYELADVAREDVVKAISVGRDLRVMGDDDHSSLDDAAGEAV